MERRDPKEMGRRIAGLRKAAGLSQDALAREVGVKPMTISRAETGYYETGPSPETLEALAKFFKVTEASLVYGDDRKAKPAPTPPSAVEEYIREEGSSLSKSVAESLRQLDYALLRIPSPSVNDVRRVRELIELNLALAKRR